MLGRAALGPTYGASRFCRLGQAEGAAQRRDLCTRPGVGDDAGIGVVARLGRAVLRSWRG
jgi:hypothetical protein